MFVTMLDRQKRRVWSSDGSQDIRMHRLHPSSGNARRSLTRCDYRSAQPVDCGSRESYRVCRTYVQSELFENGVFSEAVGPALERNVTISLLCTKDTLARPEMKQLLKKLRPSVSMFFPRFPNFLLRSLALMRSSASVTIEAPTSGVQIRRRQV
jgi:hypothetical protein